jgi:UDP-N-acetylglucosamine acyltransferase
VKFRLAESKSLLLFRRSPRNEKFFLAQSLVPEQTLKACFMPIHSTAIVDPLAEIGADVVIGPYSVIEGRVCIGARTSIGPFVHILGNTQIGSDCHIHTGAVIGDVPQDRAFQGGVSFCRIGDGVVIREHATIHRGTAPDTVTTIGDRCLIMAGSHIGHNCTLGAEVTLVNGALLGGYVQVGCKAFISGNVGVHQFVRIGELAMVGVLSKVTQDVPPYLMFGGSGKCVGVNTVGMRRAGMGSCERLELTQAFRLLYRVPGSLPGNLERLEAIATTDAVRNLIQFLRSPSRRGIPG